MTAAFVDLASYVTLPYQRGAEMLPLPIGADNAGTTAIGAYDFSEYLARYDDNPPPAAYVIAPLATLGPDDTTLTFSYMQGGGNATTSLTIPGGTAAGRSFAVPFAVPVDNTARLQSFTASPRPPGPGAASWRIYALLGNTAKLLWVLGAEKDLLRAQAADVARQRFVTSAHDAGLDAIGLDLNVPRFPPRPYSVDAQTIALYHLDDAVANGGTVVDETVHFGYPGHAGTNNGAVAGVTAKYGTGFRFGGNGSPGTIVVPSDAAFVITANAGFTVEAFASIDAGANTTPQAIVSRRASEQLAASTAAGWSIGVVNTRGFTANPFFAICDGTTELKLYADATIDDGRFHHVAGMLDRNAARARLYIDGALAASVPIGTLGAVDGGQAVHIGGTSGGNWLAGVVDEVRLSNVVRTSFHPVLGEDDASYRARLAIFNRWMLPTPQALSDALNGAVQVNGSPNSLVVVEKNRPSAIAQTTLRIVPQTVTPGASITAEGAMPGNEASASGIRADETDFDARFLTVHFDPNVDYGVDPNHQKMQAPAANALDALLALLKGASVPGKLAIDRAYDPADKGLHSLGRALVMHHEDASMPTARLAAFAHNAGFDYVRNDGPSVYASVARGERLRLLFGGSLNVSAVDVGVTTILEISPSALPLYGTFLWSVITPGPARARLVAHPADPITLKTPVEHRPRCALIVDTPGEIVIRAEFTLDGRTQSGTRPLHARPTPLADGASIDASGNFGLPESAVTGKPETTFNPIFLTNHAADPGIDFGGDPRNAQMQVGTRNALDALASLLASRGVAGKITITKSYDPAATDLHNVGRRLQFTHTTLGADQLAAAAHESFDYVVRNGGVVSASLVPGPLVQLIDAGTSKPVAGDLAIGTAVSLALEPTTLPTTGTFNYATWSIGNGAGGYDFVLRPTAKFTPIAPGALVLATTYLLADVASVLPYQIAVNLRSDLDIASTIIPKYQYDIIMNILNYFHPLGVEVLTSDLRSHVVEVEQDPTKAFPAYTFPDFRF